MPIVAIYVLAFCMERLYPRLLMTKFPLLTKLKFPFFPSSPIFSISSTPLIGRLYLVGGKKKIRVGEHISGEIPLGIGSP